MGRAKELARRRKIVKPGNGDGDGSAKPALPVRCFALTAPGPNARISPVNTAPTPPPPRDRQYPVGPTFFGSLKC